MAMAIGVLRMRDMIGNVLAVLYCVLHSSTRVCWVLGG